MNKQRHVWGFLLACCAGLVLPLTQYVWWQLHQCEPDLTSGTIELPRDFWADLGMAFLFYALVEMLLGGGGILLLHIKKCYRFRSYALAGAALGLLMGMEGVALTWQWDGPQLLLLRLGIPAASLLVLSCTYWFICRRSQPV